MTLFINSCVRRHSRTKRLADALIRKLTESRSESAAGDVVELRLEDLTFPDVDEAFLQKRDLLIEDGRFDHPMFDLARQFAAADQIVIAAPYWDLSFPSSLKKYLEQITVTGVTFTYTPEGFPRGLCRARKLYYVMTAGGDYVPEEFGYGYVKALAQSFYGIEEVSLLKAIGLDIVGADAESILQRSIDSIEV